MTKYNTYTLENGLRIIHLPSNSQVVYCGYDITAGTRNELSGEEGLAHFCEHMSFKGTARRNAIQIINAIEGLGGELNAFTNKEDTVYYAAISKEHFSQVVDVLTDIVFHSQYPQHEIDKEVEVICDEIESYNDSPAELIYDDAPIPLPMPSVSCVVTTALRRWCSSSMATSTSNDSARASNI